MYQGSGFLRHGVGNQRLRGSGSTCNDDQQSQWEDEDFDPL